MHVICKTNDAFEDQLTTGARYLTLEQRGNSVQIVNDLGQSRWYGINRFRHAHCPACQAA